MAKPKIDKIVRLENKLNKQMEKANKTRDRLEKARASGSASAHGSLSNSTPS